MSRTDAVLRNLWTGAGNDPASLLHVDLPGDDPVLPSSFAVAAMAQAAIAAAGLAAADVFVARGGGEQKVRVDRRHAAAEFRSERYLSVERPAGNPAPLMWDPIAGLYRTRDHRWVRIHTNFAHHRDGFLALLECTNDREAVQAALMQWEGQAFEDAAASASLVATMFRSPGEWAAHPQGQAAVMQPLLEITQIGDAPPEPLPPALRPLSGVRVLDLTRIIAGPVAGRTLAAHGADVLNVTCPRLPSIHLLVMDTGRGKRTASIDLDTSAGADTLRMLIRDADIFLHGYRPGGLAALGFSEEQLLEHRPGIITVSLSAYGHTGPWAGRRGFDSLTQNANGINWEEALAASTDGQIDRPKELPAQALDHAAGQLLAFGAMVALQRRAKTGGAWRVRTSLARVGEWLKSLPRIEDGLLAPDPSVADVAEFLETTPSGFGRLTAVRHAAQLGLTPTHWALPAMPLGSHAAEWVARPA